MVYFVQLVQFKIKNPCSEIDFTGDFIQEQYSANEKRESNAGYLAQARKQEGKTVALS